MSEDEIIKAAISYIKSLFADDHSGHDVGHTLRVYHNAIMIADSEPECDKTIVGLAALLHDVDDHKLFSTEDQANARSFLKKNNVSEDLTERICSVIRGVSFSQNRGKVPETLEGKIVQDADRLDAMGAIGIARTFAYGGSHARSMEESVQHFYDKLLLLRDEMNTAMGKELAEERHAFMLDFLEEYKKE